MKSLVTRSLILAAAASLMLFSSSCAAEPAGNDARGESPSSEGTSEDTNGGQSQDGADTPADDFVSEELEGALVSNFPSEVPLYSGLILNSSSGISEVSGEPQWSVMMSTSDPLETVDAAIREAYSTNGWVIGSDMEAHGGYMLIARGGGPTTSITYNDMLGSDITITYGVGG